VANLVTFGIALGMLQEAAISTLRNALVINTYSNYAGNSKTQDLNVEIQKGIIYQNLGGIEQQEVLIFSRIIQHSSIEEKCKNAHPVPNNHKLKIIYSLFFKTDDKQPKYAR
jgi:hypothetical protein